MTEPKNIVPTRSNKCKELPPIDFLRTIFQYDPETGILWFLERDIEFYNGNKAAFAQFKRFNVGREAGTKCFSKGKKCYMQVYVHDETMPSGRRILMVHRIAAAMSGLPLTRQLYVDHINGDIWDNRAENLRLATISENSRNCKPHKDKISKLPRGVFKNGENSYSARISLGSFPTPELAHEAVCKAAKLYHGEFARFD